MKNTALIKKSTMNTEEYSEDVLDHGAVEMDQITVERPNENPVYWRYRKPILALSAAVGVLPNFLLRALYVLTRAYESLPCLLIRYICLRSLLQGCGENVYIGKNVEMKFLDRTILGTNVSIHQNTYMDARGGIEIGDDVSIAHGVSIVSFEHGYDDTSRPIRRNPYFCRKIVVGDDVWIGAGVRVLSGAILGSRNIVAANSVVTRKTNNVDGVVLGGIPARIIKRLPTQ